MQLLLLLLSSQGPHEISNFFKTASKLRLWLYNCEVQLTYPDKDFLQRCHGDAVLTDNHVLPASSLSTDSLLQIMEQI